MFLRANTTHTPVMGVNTAVPATQGSSAAGIIAVANGRAAGPGGNPVSVPAPAMESALSIRAKGYDAPRLPVTRDTDCFGSKTKPESPDPWTGSSTDFIRAILYLCDFYY